MHCSTWGNKAEYIKISSNGPNALDFHIAFHIGQIATNDPTAYFHIISKDTGFDPLIQHLKSRNVFAARSLRVSAIPLVKAVNTKSPTERLAIIITHLQRLKNSKPGTLKTLSNTIGTIFQKQLTSPEIDTMIKGLESKSLIKINETKAQNS